MQAFIGSKLLSSNVAQSTQKPFEIYDSRLSGFTLWSQAGADFGALANTWNASVNKSV